MEGDAVDFYPNNMTDQNKQGLIIAGISGAIFLLINVVVGSPSADMHFQDTYIVMDTTVKVLLFIVIAVFIASLLAAIISKFRVKLYNRALVFSLFLLFSAGFYLFSVFL